MKIEKKTIETTDTHPKGWGYEKWIENIPEYCGKLLHFEAGKCSSMHFHVKKKETMFLIKGRIMIDMIEPATGEKYSVVLTPGDSVLIPPGQVHQIFSVMESDLIEFSTTHEDSDSYRVWKGD